MHSLYAKQEVRETGKSVGTGWLPPLPDLRDYTEDEPDIKAIAQRLGVVSSGKRKAPAAPTSVDLRSWCSPVEDQGALGSCTAHAAVGIVEYFERRAHGKHINGSRLFIYKATRDLMGVTGDTGAWLRNTMGALALCGVPPEKYWPYTDSDPAFDREPTSFVYAVADNYEALRYFCHDPQGAGVAPQTILSSVKKFLAAGIPSMFGFFGFPSNGDSDVPGAFPVPCPGERAIWGHAVVAVGYNDRKRITNTRCSKSTTGAFLIRNSWGTGWGDAGYGWLPYEYVKRGFALDFWSLLRMGWVETGQFGLTA
jgi:C1A family cysteine protease